MSYDEKRFGAQTGLRHPNKALRLQVVGIDHAVIDQGQTGVSHDYLVPHVLLEALDDEPQAE